MSTDLINVDILKGFVERIERLEDEKSHISSDIKDVYGEARNAGYDVKTIKQIIKIRSMEKDDVQEQEMLLETYKNALGL